MNQLVYHGVCYVDVEVWLRFLLYTIVSFLMTIIRLCCIVCPSCVPGISLPSLPCRLFAKKHRIICIGKLSLYIKIKSWLLYSTDNGSVRWSDDGAWNVQMLTIFPVCVCQVFNGTFITVKWMVGLFAPTESWKFCIFIYHNI